VMFGRFLDCAGKNVLNFSQALHLRRVDTVEIAVIV